MAPCNAPVWSIPQFSVLPQGVGFWIRISPLFFGFSFGFLPMNDLSLSRKPVWPKRVGKEALRVLFFDGWWSS